MSESVQDSPTPRLILEPATLNTERRLSTVLESGLVSRYNSAFPTYAYNLIRDEEWEELSRFLGKWEWSLRRKTLFKWHDSDEFRTLCFRLVDVTIPCLALLEELTVDEAATDQIVSIILEGGSSRMTRVAREIVRTAVVKGRLVFSYTRHIRRWCNTVKATTVAHAREFGGELSALKTEIKERVVETGWTGFAYLTVFTVLPGQAMAVTLPPPWNLASPLPGIIVGVIADGRKIL